MSRYHARIPSRQWAKLRAQVLIRDGHRCVKCARAGKLEIDHIEPLEAGGHPTDPDNLQALCRDCHIEKTREDRGVEDVPGAAEWRELLRESPD